ncbi:M42 family metallopeptidase [Tuwongella immobilis]|uniref:Peptidase M42 family protein n=1 Tax=Tuwongella immobilis TaxID=692036 RepID=A0A6C2YND7_9BACT|nr:M42 family metallopeptidase [Tuwongella immobilis]VIP02575.1 peptidase m42 family protein : Probable endoglucanase OS=Planctomyces maris DSM 8797 GN=PM8797T_19834 PE=4 SV=1: Peptidase_M42 [Tuwongella immobilis]VTS01814.1 peptidase m42 family protein : Probable endoglucanase OS=Planctomyces maris DSM 8797 GN=PM8797T_19834 PE=4 SV=1: Peptidase_M42 [Tuwongella immobilis]
MDERSQAFFRQLLDTPSPSGFERPIQDVVRAWVGEFAHEVRTDWHGNVIAARHPAPNQPSPMKIMYAGHCDQIALMVEHIDNDGYLYIQPIGGFDMQILLGQYFTVWTKSGPVPGVLSRRPPHLLTNEERNKVPQFTDVWVDIGAKDRADAESIVRLGDPVTYQLQYRTLRNGLAASPAMDDKVGLWVVMEALRLISQRNIQASVYSVSTVQEEIGLRGAITSTHSVAPTVGIAVDVCHATDTPGNDKKQVGDTRLGAGPVIFRGANINPRVFDLLESVAQTHKIPVQIRGVPRATGTDANAMQISRDGVATALIGIPNRYMHSPVEVVHLDDLVNAAKLLAEFALAVTPEMDWTP